MKSENGGPGGSPDAAQGGVQPRIIPQTEHPIREKDIDQEALKVLYRLRDAGFAGYLVGGGVRDLYLNKRPKDFDVSTDARPGQLRRLFRNSRTIGRRFRLVQVFFRGNKIIEVSTLRSQGEPDADASDAILPSNNTFGTLEEDAFRRDLTINSLFYEIENKTIIDYVGGVEDLDRKIIRIVGEPERRIIRDPVRMLRAIRHAARNRFHIEEQSWQAILRHREKLTLCPPSRIRDELLKDLHSGAAASWFDVATRSSIFYVLLPCYEKLFVHQDDRESYNSLRKLLAVIDRLYTDPDHGEDVVIPDHMLFAVMLLPWMQHCFGLLDRESVRGSYHKLALAIRDELDVWFGEKFNIRRMIRQSMVTLFVHLPTFIRCLKKGKWPAKLQKKSYFADCSRFAMICHEAEGGRQTDVALFVASGTGKSLRSRGKNRPGRRGINPAFSSRKQGVFGLRQV